MAAKVDSSSKEAEWYTEQNETNAGDTVLYLGDGTSGQSTQDGDIDPSSGASESAPSSSGNVPAASFDTLKSHLSQEMAGQLWKAGRQSTQSLINAYAHIDYLRPYYDVEPTECLNRLLKSFIPNPKVQAPQDAPTELYGPTMLVFTLVAILLYGMKTSGHMVEDGTLIGTSLAVCLGYWVGVSSVITFTSFLFNAHLSLLQVLSLTGYSITAHCSVLLLTTVFDHRGLPSVFYILWLIGGGLTAAKMCGVLVSRSWSLRDGVVLSGIMVSFHLLSILYLRFAYHKVYEAVAEVL